VTARDWQYRTPQWLQGKTLEAATPIGSWLVTDDEFDATVADVGYEVDGETVRRGNTNDLHFTPDSLPSYVSSVLTLLGGDVVATGTPADVGHAQQPPRCLTDGAVPTTRIDGIGRCRKRCRREVLR
jgi:acylpyruvate hydrolase